MGMKRVSTLALAGAVTGLMLSGCSLQKDLQNWKVQNPFEDKADDIQKGQPPEKPLPKPIIISPDSIRIDAPVDILEFREGVESEIAFSFRILTPGVTGVMRLDGLEEFPGSSFDEKTGKLNWTPPEDFVKKTGENFRHLLLKVVVSTDSGNHLSGDRIFEVVVSRRQFQPVLKKMGTEFNENIVEGTTRDFVVQVEDPESGSTAYPQLLFTAGAGSYSDGASLISCDLPANDPQNKILWNFKCKVSAYGEFTGSSKTYGYNVKAVSGFGSLSNVVSGTFRIETSVEEAVWSLGDTNSADFEFKRKKANELSFFVSDPKLESSLSVEVSIENLPVDKPENKSVNCESVNGQKALFCHLKWTAPKKTDNEYHVSFIVTSKSPEWNSHETATHTFDVNLNMSNR